MMKTLIRALVLLAMLAPAQAAISGIRYTSYSPGGAVQNTDTVLIDRGGNSNVRLAFPDIAAYANSHASGIPNSFAAYSSSGLLTSLPADCSLTTVSGSAATSTCPDIPLTSTITSAACGHILTYTLPAPITVTMPSASSPGMTQGCEFAIYATATAGQISLSSNGSTIASLNPLPIPSGTGCWIRSDGSNWKANLAACSALTNSLARITPVGTAGQIFFNSGGTQVSALTIGGDAVLYTSTGALTLNTVNATTGTFGSASSIPSFTVNGKGQVTFASSAPLAAGGSSGQLQFNSGGSLGGLSVVPAANGGAGTVLGILKANGTGTVSAATPGTDYMATGTKATLTAQQNFGTTTLTDAATISWNLDTAQVAKVTLGGNRTLSNPTNMVDGGTYVLRVTQDGTGSRTLAYGTAYKWPGGTAPTLSTGAGKVDLLTFVSDGTNMNGTFALDMR